MNQDSSGNRGKRAPAGWLVGTLASLIAVSSCLAAVDAAGQRIYRIMPVGDSITEGGSSFVSYRFSLWEKLFAAGYLIEYVGSRTNKSRIGPLRHEGYGGKTAEFLAANVGKSFEKNPADIVLLHAGHNHTSDEQPVARIVSATESLLGTLRKINPQVIVLLAQVIPSGKLPKYSYIPELNAELAKLAARLHSVASPVVLVNQAEGFDWRSDTVADRVHPNARGAEKMADKWFAALTRVLEKLKQTSPAAVAKKSGNGIPSPGTP